MVGAVRFELTTSCTRNKRATRLRYAPTIEDQIMSANFTEINDEMGVPNVIKFHSAFPFALPGNSAKLDA